MSDDQKLFGTSCLRVAVTGVVVRRLFGSFSLGNFRFGFWLGNFEARVFWQEMES
jgi:hypothetical protein